MLDALPVNNGDSAHEQLEAQSRRYLGNARVGMKARCSCAGGDDIANSEDRLDVPAKPGRVDGGMRAFADLGCRLDLASDSLVGTRWRRRQLRLETANGDPCTCRGVQKAAMTRGAALRHSSSRCIWDVTDSESVGMI